MAVGLPGTGIGGLFYLLLGALQPLRAGVRALRGEPAGAARRMGTTLGLLAAVVATLWLQAWALGLLVEALRPGAAAQGQPGGLGVLTGPTAGAYMKWAGLAGLIGLGFVFVAVHALRLLARRMPAAPVRATPRPDASPAADETLARPTPRLRASARTRPRIPRRPRARPRSTPGT